MYQAELINMYNNAIGNLQQAGYSVEEWRLPSSAAVGELDAVELRVKVDAVLAYFSAATKQIGFAGQRR